VRFLAAIVALALTTLPGPLDAEGILSRFGRGLLLRRLADNDPAVRRDAAGEIGRRGDREAVPDLLVRLRSETNIETRRAILEALGLVADPRAVPVLLEMAARPGEPARGEAIEALGAIADPRAVGPVSVLLADPRLEDVAARALGRMGSTALPRLLSLLGDEHASTGAARGLGELGDARAMPGLIAVLSAAVPMHRAAAARALGMLGDPRARKALGAVARDDPDSEVRKAAAEALGILLPSRSSTADLGGAVTRGSSLARVTALVDRADDEARRRLEAMARRPGPDRREAIRGLALVAHPRHGMAGGLSSEVLGEICLARPAALARDCAFALGAAEIEGAQEWLEALLVHREPSVRRQAAIALGRLGVMEPLRQASPREADPAVRAAIVWALGEHPAPESVPVVLAALRGEHDEVLLDAIATAGALGDARLVPSLLERLSDADRLLRAAAALALGRTGDRRAAAALRARLQIDPDRLVRANAARALGMIAPEGSLRALDIAAESDPDDDVRSAAADASDAGRRVRTLPMPRGEDVFRARFVDTAGAPAPGLPWVAELPDGRVCAGWADDLGEVVIFDVPRGTTRLWLR
jgi:HEAT repeat protein